MDGKTIDYYNQNAASFTAGTVSVGFGEMQQRFTRLLPEHGYILDFGCGAGRDAKAFLEQGFSVDAVDGSRELCKIASDYTGLPVRQMYFQELDERDKYDGIWACASILHLKREELPDVLQRMARAVKTGGAVYVSFKYGTFEGERSGRYFTDMDRERFAALLCKVPKLRLEEEWISQDVRPGRGEEQWLNVILQKC